MLVRCDVICNIYIYTHKWNKKIPISHVNRRWHSIQPKVLASSQLSHYFFFYAIFPFLSFLYTFSCDNFSDHNGSQLHFIEMDFCNRLFFSSTLQIEKLYSKNDTNVAYYGWFGAWVVALLLFVSFAIPNCHMYVMYILSILAYTCLHAL